MHAEGDRNATLLKVTNLRVRFPVRTGLLKRVTGEIRAVDGVTFDIRRGQTLGLVGESGSGKTTVGRAVLRLLPSDARVDGSVTFDGTAILALGSERLRRMRRRMQTIFQDPYGSLNPLMRVTDLIGDPLEIHNLARGAKKMTRVSELLQLVGLDQRMRSRFPRGFSGGQRQRIAIARALAVSPEFVVCDEPVTALDVSVQAQILNVLTELQRRFSLTYLFIAHDLGVVRHMSDVVAVMYLGKLVEIGPSRTIYEAPAHPYTRSLLSAIPSLSPDARHRRTRIVLQGDIPSPLSIPVGCRFHTRCWLYQRLGRPQDCRTTEPDLRATAAGSSAACHHAEDVSRGSGEWATPQGGV